MMKRNFITIFIIAFSLQLSMSKDLFKVYYPSNETYNIISDSYPGIDMSLIHDSILFLQLNQGELERILRHDVSFLRISFPFFNQNSFNLELEEFTVSPENLFVTRHTNKGIIKTLHTSEIKSYRIINNDDLDGVFIFSPNGSKAIITIQEEIYQISLLNTKELDLETIYYILNVKNSPKDFDFICSSDFLQNTIDVSNISHNSSSVSKCVDIAIEIDYFTFQSFSSFQEAIDWALEILAVVSELFVEEVNVGLKSSSAQVWEVEDPYASFIDSPQDMLIALRDNWYTNELFSSVSRDLVHLFSKRDDTGTGGIAFLNGIGSQWNGYGFSSNLTGDSDYIDLPVPYFFWNIYCFAHELGHNFGANHTQWCGWEGGPIDNCANLEETSSSQCQDYLNNPQPQIGTIMSYCHTWSYDAGGGIILKFHNLIKNTIMSYLEMQNIEPCNDENMIVLGCLDPSACNYNQFANTDGDSCIYADLGYDCFGNCLNDSNVDGLCDDAELNLLNNQLSLINIYPNPTTKYLKFAFNSIIGDVFSLKLFNAIGKLILYKTHVGHSTEIDVSNLPSGVYNAQLLKSSNDFNNNELIHKNIIIQ